MADDEKRLAPDLSSTRLVELALYLRLSPGIASIFIGGERVTREELTILLDMAGRAATYDLLDLIADLWEYDQAGAYADDPAARNAVFHAIGRLACAEFKDRALLLRKEFRAKQAPPPSDD